MQVGFLASARERGGRHIRFLAVTAVVAAVNVWLWSQIVADAANRNRLSNIQLIVAGIAFLMTLGFVAALWRNPLSRNVHIMSTPALRQALATHHAGHAVAAHTSDPTRVRRIDISLPCHHHRSVVPAISHSSLRAELLVSLAGMAAEEVLAGESGSNSAADLAMATETAVNMVGAFGMGGSLVSLRTSRPRRRKFITRTLDDPRTRKEIEALLRETKRDAIRLVLENRHLILAVRDALMRRHRLSTTQIRELIAGAERTRHTDDQVLVDLRVISGGPLPGEF